MSNCDGCIDYSYADHIRDMSDEELAEELLNLFAGFYTVEWKTEDVLDILKSPAEEVCSQ